MAYDVHGQNRHTPRELLDAGGQLALKRDISSPDEVLKIAGQIAALFGFDLANWQDMFDFDDLRAAIAGEYVGTDPALNAIQTVVGTIRRFATGIIDPSRLPLIPLAHIGEAAPNLLENGSFDGDDPIEQTEGWTFNPTVGRTKPGSAQTTGNGMRRVLLSNAVLCTPGQQFDVGGFVTWSMLTGGGAGAFKLSAVAYAADDSHVGETVVASIDSPSSAQAWTGLLGTYTVPEGAAKIRLQIEVAATVTGGTINWDDLSVTKYGNLPQRFVNGLASALGDLGAGISALVTNVGDFFDRLTGKVGTTIADLQSWAAQLKTILSGGTVGAGIFPTLDNGLRAAVSGVQGFAQQILDKIVQAIRGIPVVGAGLADLFDDVAALRSTADTANATAITADTKAVTAQASADTARATAQAAVQTTGISTSGTMGDLKWTRLRYTGDGSWTVPSPSAGYRFERFDWQLTGAGCGGPRPKTQAQEQMPAALAGGFIRRSFSPDEIGPAGTVYNLTVPLGAAGATSTGLGATGARAVVRRASNNAVLVDSGEPGTSGIYTSAGIPSTDQKPGAGGVGSSGYWTGGENSTWQPLDNAGAGQPTIQAAGGAAGHPNNGWFGGGAAPGAGVNAPTSDPYYAFCGSGGGSAAGMRNEVGGRGGDPGGAGGSGSPHNGGSFGFQTATNGGPGGRAEIVIWIVEAPL
ncbi:hypothetical protein [Tsukamurella strandjordii]|uniref:Minor tail protein n=1 Tax=Tsukamurella strandjordii TaxID=147577 RepID=A0AA90NHG3_9ACTN|nr:hypothetical protein [Tsukamurella strandjordii]MDP0399193.1 hypothetical protein [Tsukamurella strandjordii]